LKDNLSSIVLFVILLIAVIVALLMPIPGNSMLVKSMTNVSHVWLFLCLTFTALKLLRARSWKLYLGVSMLLLLFGFSMELIQPLSGRTNSLQDLIKNSFGIAAGTLLYIAASSNGSRPMLRVTTFLCCLGILASSSIDLIYQVLATITLEPLPAIATFESRFSNSRIKSIGNSIFTVITSQLDSGKTASNRLLVEFGPDHNNQLGFEKYSGFRIVEPHANWNGFHQFTFEVFNPSDYIITFTLRIDDKFHDQTYYDRFNKAINALPGKNKITVPLSSIQHMGQTPGFSKRTMDISKISNIKIFLTTPSSNTQLYFDNFLLE